MLGSREFMRCTVRAGKAFPDCDCSSLFIWRCHTSPLWWWHRVNYVTQWKFQWRLCNCALSDHLGFCHRLEEFWCFTFGQNRRGDMDEVLRGDVTWLSPSFPPSHTHTRTWEIKQQYFWSSWSLFNVTWESVEQLLYLQTAHLCNGKRCWEGLFVRLESTLTPC